MYITYLFDTLSNFDVSQLAPPVRLTKKVTNGIFVTASHVSSKISHMLAPLNIDMNMSEFNEIYQQVRITEYRMQKKYINHCFKILKMDKARIYQSVLKKSTCIFQCKCMERETFNNF